MTIELPLGAALNDVNTKLCMIYDPQFPCACWAAEFIDKIEAGRHRAVPDFTDIIAATKNEKVRRVTSYMGT